MSIHFKPEKGQSFSFSKNNDLIMIYLMRKIHGKVRLTLPYNTLLVILHVHIKEIHVKGKMVEVRANNYHISHGMTSDSKVISGPSHLTYD